ncbi:MAG: phosphoenolpyruvate synthase [Candidatus Paceibacterota bacterium]
MKELTKKFKEVGINDVPEVGGKNASLGEMIKHLKPKGVKLPDGFIVTATAFRYFLKETGLDKRIREVLRYLNTRNLKKLEEKTAEVRKLIIQAKLPDDLREEIVLGYRIMEKEYGKNVDVAIRSSATAEDLPDASFAGAHETYLNVRGIEDVLKHTQMAMASLFTPRATSYRVDKGFDHFKIALSVGIQKMVRADKASSGVIFTLDTESGFNNIILINGVCGLGELIVQGEVTPDEWLVFKPLMGERKIIPIIDRKLGEKNRKMIYQENGNGTKIIKTSDKEKETFVLSDKEVLKLAEWSSLIEEHYSIIKDRWQPMDIEWAKDGKTGELFIVQARPETVHSLRDMTKLRSYERLQNGKEIVRGASVGNKIAAGKARIIIDVKDIRNFKAGEILVTDMTDPDWEPIMKIAAGIITDKGGRTSHAAIVSRELGIPCIVGSGTATKKIKTGEMVTIDTTGSEGIVFEGELRFKINEIDVKKAPKVNVKIMMNIATPESAFEKSFLPNSGVGLAREEFIIAGGVGVHPMALIKYNQLSEKLKKEIDKKTSGWKSKTDFYVDKLAFGIAKIAAAFYPKPVIVRFSDFKTNEYATLLGGEDFEPKEDNPMIGWRGASRYYHPNFRAAFDLECQAIKKVRDEMGLTNTATMIPFCRTVEEGKKVIKIMGENGLQRSGRDRNGLKIYVMCEIPSNVILAEQFLDVFDGMSIGSNDLTQLAIGIDRDGGELLRGIADERDEAVKELIRQVIKICKKRNKYIGICGQAPSDYPEFAEFLMKEGIESMSLNPDSVMPTLMHLSKIKR